MIIAWDIETCPLPAGDDAPGQQRRFRMLLERELERNPEAVEAEALDGIMRKVRSLHPALGWICCISVAPGHDVYSLRAPKSYIATCPEEEKAMLESFWADLARLKGRLQWVTFNGKRFDVEYLITRSLRWGLTPTRTDLLCRNIWRTEPHCDLACVWRGSAMSLHDVCELLDVESPKAHLDGSGVCAAMEAGDVEAVRRYSQADVIATFQCYARMAPVLV